MGGMSGIELHDELLRQRYDLPLIFMTGHGDVGMAVARMKLGAVDFLEKPFDDKQLISTVENAFNQARVKQNDAQRREQRQELLARLTPREQQVLELIVYLPLYPPERNRFYQVTSYNHSFYNIP